MPKKKFSKKIEDCLHNHYDLSYNCKLSEDWIDNNLSKIAWWAALQRQTLSENFLRKHLDLIIQKNELTYLITYQNLSNQFLEELISCPFWKDFMFEIISEKQMLSETFIDKYKDELSWAEICQHQKLSSAFMENHLEYLEFAFVSRYQKLDAEFVSKHFDKLDYDWLLKNKSHSPEVKKVLLKNAKKIVYSFL